MDVVFAKDTGSLPAPNGAPVFVQRGSHWPVDDEIVRANPGWFTDDPRYGLSWSGEPPAEMAEPPVEAATAAPGEKRNTRRA
jgi:hypothetical protein